MVSLYACISSYCLRMCVSRLLWATLPDNKWLISWKEFLWQTEQLISINQSIDRSSYWFLCNCRCLEAMAICGNITCNQWTNRSCHGASPENFKMPEKTWNLYIKYCLEYCTTNYITYYTNENVLPPKSASSTLLHPNKRISKGSNSSIVASLNVGRWGKPSLSSSLMLSVYCFICPT